MPLTPEEVTTLKTALDGGTLDANHELLAPLATLGLVLRTPAQEDTFKANYKTDVISKHDADAYKTVTDAFKGISKVEPLANERATDYIKRVYTSVEKERNDLKTKVDGGNGTDADKSQIQKLETQITDLKATHQRELQTQTEKLTTFQQKATKDNAFAGIQGRLRKDLDAALLPDIIEARMNRFDKEYNLTFDENGNEVVTYKTGSDAGQPVKDANFKQLTVAEVMASKVFDGLIDTKPQQPGSGAPKPNQGGTPPPAGSKPTKDSFVLPSTITTKVKLNNYLMESGLTADDDDYHVIMEKQGANLPLGSDND